MAISGHKTRSVSERYNIVSEEDLANAVDRTSKYVDSERAKGPQIVPLRRVANQN